MSPATLETPSVDSQLSAAQLAANRENAQSSTGPRTEAGKNRSRLNAVRHGLTGQFHALSLEDQAAFDHHCASLIEDLRPATFQENLLAMSIAQDQWRLNRARALENNIFALGMSGEIGDATEADSPEVHAAVCQARVWLSEGRSIQLLALYETRIRRNLEKNEKQLAELQAARQSAYAEALEKAKLLARLALRNGETYDPAADFPPENGFVFSTPQIHRLLATEQRLHEAKRLAKNGWNRHDQPEKTASPVRQAA